MNYPDFFGFNAPKKVAENDFAGTGNAGADDRD
jgi:hypothetical protein